MIITNSVLALAAFCALLMTWLGWRNASKVAKEQSIMATNYSIYKDILSQVNDLQSKNSRYTSDLQTHVGTTAAMLNELRGVGEYTTPAPDKRAAELGIEWGVPSMRIIQDALDLKFSALDLTRILDMSGADFGNNTKIYNALWLIYHDLDNATTEIQDRWSHLPVLEISIQQYEWLKRDTQNAIKVVEEFGSCIDDVLKHTYNQLVAIPMNKTQKEVDMTEKRRIITLDGLRDNRVKNAS